MYVVRINDFEQAVIKYKTFFLLKFLFCFLIKLTKEFGDKAHWFEHFICDFAYIFHIEIQLIHIYIDPPVQNEV